MAAMIDEAMLEAVGSLEASKLRILQCLDTLCASKLWELDESEITAAWRELKIALNHATNAQGAIEYTLKRWESENSDKIAARVEGTSPPANR